MSVLITVEIPVDAAKIDGAQQLFQEILPDTRAFEGCESVSVHANRERGVLLLLERWTSPEAHKACMQWRMARPEDAARLGELMAGATPKLTVFEDLA